MQRHYKFLFLGLLALTSCEVGPDYVRPYAPPSANFKEAAGGWIQATPLDDSARGAWWSIYKDPVLDILERQVEVSNQNLKAAEAAYREAVAVSDVTRASLFPTISVGGSGITAGSGAQHTNPISTFGVSANAAWVPDVWGRIRRQLESDESNAEANAADLASARLSAQALLATNYFDLRSQDELKRILDATSLADRKSLEFTQNQYEAGIAAKVDVITAQTLLENVEAQATGTGVKRAQLEHSIAVLIGKPPSEYSLAVAALRHDVPIAPVGLPAMLLERRPDISAAERLMKAANAEIGVQTAAYYPNITLDASFGYQSAVLGGLIQASNSLWSFGPSISETVFDAGARDAAVEEARAAYDQAVANYRQTVLTSFQQVEDNLAALRILADQAKMEDKAVNDAKESESLTLNQYKEGIVPYINVLSAETINLSNQQTALSIQQTRLEASVALIQALGGGWDTSQLPHQ